MSRIAGRWDRTPAGRYFNGEFGPAHYIHVYAIEPKGGGCVKFGRAINVKSRFSSIQTGSPVKLVLLGSVFVPGDVETEIHTYLKDHKSHGEWFYPTVLVKQVAALIEKRDAKGLLAEIGLYRWIPSREREQQNIEERLSSGPRSLDLSGQKPGQS